MTSNINVNYHVTFNSILRANNLNKAVKQVVQNRGSGGIDRMTTQQLLTPKGTAIIHRKIKDVREGKYKPLPVRQVYIPKDNGEQRPLGIPTVIDRVIQQAIANELTKLYEPKFSEYIYGFRPNRSCHHALNKVLDHIHNGYLYVIDMDLAKFFDTVTIINLCKFLVNVLKTLELYRLFTVFYELKSWKRELLKSPL